MVLWSVGQSVGQSDGPSIGWLHGRSVVGRHSLIGLLASSFAVCSLLLFFIRLIVRLFAR